MGKTIKVKYSSCIKMTCLALVLQARSCKQSSSRGLTLARKIEDDPTKNINQSSSRGNYLYLAVSSGDVEKVRIVLDRINEDQRKGIIHHFYNEPDPDSKQTALAHAIAQNYTAIAQELVKCSYIKFYDRQQNYNVLALALEQYANPTMAEIVLQAEQKRIDTLYQSDVAKLRLPSGNTPLHVAIKHSWEGVMTLLIAQLNTVIDLCATDGKKRMPLHRLARKKRKEFFMQVVKKICALQTRKHQPTDKLLDWLWQKDKNDLSVFANVYLPSHINKMHARPHMDLLSDGSAMFDQLLRFIKEEQHLSLDAHIPSIGAEIVHLEERGLISKPYGTILKNLLGYKGVRLVKAPSHQGGFLIKDTRQKDDVHSIKATHQQDNLIPLDQQKPTALHKAVKKGGIDSIKKEATGLPLEKLCAIDNRLRTPLHLAAKKHNREAIKVLLNTLCTLCQGNGDMLLAKLIAPDPRGLSVFACGYLSASYSLINLSPGDVRTFKYILSLLKPYLHKEHFKQIKNDLLQTNYLYKSYRPEWSDKTFPKLLCIIDDYIAL